MKKSELHKTVKKCSTVDQAKTLVRNIALKITSRIMVVIIQARKIAPEIMNQHQK